MEIVSIIILSLICAFSVSTMINAKKVINESWYKVLDTEGKMKVIAVIKEFWRNNIILISIMIGEILIMVSTFMGRSVSYSSQLSIVVIILGVIAFIVIIKSRKSYYKKIAEFK